MNTPIQSAAVLASCEAVARLRDMQAQIIHGKNTFGEIADCIEQLQAFKDWVHSYLDSKGVPHHPPGTHGAEGCRIGDRMDWVMAEVEALKRDKERLEWIVEHDMLDFLACHVLGWSEPTGVDGLRAAIDGQIAMKKEREQSHHPERPKQ